MLVGAGQAELVRWLRMLAVVGGGRNEEAYRKNAAGVRIKQLPSRRQQQRGNGSGWLAGACFLAVLGAFIL